jgi:hypothetical protein
MTSSGDLHFRATDADRDRVVQLLRAAAGEGALSVDELEERMSAAYAAVTRGDLAALVADLPPQSPEPRSLPAEVHPLGVERGPVFVLVLSILTIGLYGIYWWYVVNREMRDFARSAQPTHPLAGSSPLTSVLALALGWILIVPVFVTAHSTARRVGDAMTLSGLPAHDRPSAPLYMLLFTVGGLLVFPPLFYMPLLQEHLNRAWRQAGALEPPAPHDWLTDATAA